MSIYVSLVQLGGNKQTIKSYENLAARKAKRWYVYLRRTVLVYISIYYTSPQGDGNIDP
jgi:hypothetical protein